MIIIIIGQIAKCLAFNDRLKQTSYYYVPTIYYQGKNMLSFACYHYRCVDTD
jgi:hypothetical protein